MQVASEAGVPAKLVTTRPARSDGSYPEPVLTASTRGDGRLVIHDQTAWTEFLGRVGGVPQGLEVILDFVSRGQWQVQGTGKAAFVEAGVAADQYDEGMAVEEIAAEGAPDSYDDARMQQLMAAAKGKDVPDLTDDERSFVAELVADLDRIEQAGNAWDIPISTVI